jgi:hypothetical protein
MAEMLELSDFKRRDHFPAVMAFVIDTKGEDKNRVLRVDGMNAEVPIIAEAIAGTDHVEVVDECDGFFFEFLRGHLADGSRKGWMARTLPQD